MCLKSKQGDQNIETKQQEPGFVGSFFDKKILFAWVNVLNFLAVVK